MLRTTTVIAAMLAAAVALAACGGSSSPNTNTTASSNVSAGLKLAECMRKHGVPDFPDPGNGPNQIQANQGSGGSGNVTVDGVQLNVSPQTLNKAMTACQKNAPKGPPISGSQLARLRQGALKMAECMRSHGVPNFPDPQVTTGPDGRGVGVKIGVGPAGGGGLNPQSPAFQKAQRQCQGVLKAALPHQKALQKAAG